MAKLSNMKMLKDGLTEQVTVTLSPGETLNIFRKDSFYKLGEPIGDVVSGNILNNSQLVYWDSLTQEWLDGK